MTVLSSCMHAARSTTSRNDSPHLRAAGVSSEAAGIRLALCAFEQQHPGITAVPHSQDLSPNG
jgi:hypothetical protein